jgi:AcrR family transcriptional regulator
VTKGALYHHFGGKRQLFEAVFEEEHRRLAEVGARAYAGNSDQRVGLHRACGAFLEGVAGPRVICEAAMYVARSERSARGAARRRRRAEAHHRRAVGSAGGREEVILTVSAGAPRAGAGSTFMGSRQKDLSGTPASSGSYFRYFARHVRFL